MPGLESMSFLPPDLMASSGASFRDLTNSMNTTHHIENVYINGNQTLPEALGGSVSASGGGPFEKQMAGTADGAGSAANKSIAASNFGAFFGPGSRGG